MVMWIIPCIMFGELFVLYKSFWWCCLNTFFSWRFTLSSDLSWTHLVSFSFPSSRLKWVFSYKSFVDSLRSVSSSYFKSIVDVLLSTVVLTGVLSKFDIESVLCPPLMVWALLLPFIKSVDLFSVEFTSSKWNKIKEPNKKWWSFLATDVG